MCAFPASRLGLEGIGISPDCNPENRASPREVLFIAPSLNSLSVFFFFFPFFKHKCLLIFCLLCLQLFNWALEPAEDHVLDKLFELGYLDAAVWAVNNPVEKTVEDEAALYENGAAT